MKAVLFESLVTDLAERVANIVLQRIREAPEVDPLLNRRQVAEMFGVNPKTVTRWQLRPDFPAPQRPNGTHPRWRKSALLDWNGAQQQ